MSRSRPQEDRWPLTAAGVAERLDAARARRPAPQRHPCLPWPHPDDVVDAATGMLAVPPPGARGLVLELGAGAFLAAEAAGALSGRPARLADLPVGVRLQAFADDDAVRLVDEDWVIWAKGHVAAREAAATEEAAQVYEALRANRVPAEQAAAVTAGVAAPAGA